MNPIQLLAVLALGGTLLVACNPKEPVDENETTAPAPADVPPPATDPAMPPAEPAPTDMPPPPDGSTPTDPAQEPAPPPNG
jgi:hypothetical protein